MKTCNGEAARQNLDGKEEEAWEPRRREAQTTEVATYRATLGRTKLQHLKLLDSLASLDDATARQRRERTNTAKDADSGRNAASAGREERKNRWQTEARQKEAKRGTKESKADTG
ncbi:hypothetical protein TRVL_04140 [Trypanosoma vivax]|nr:hypothetical protein TRVL_04140 [Trypanosoma vivax]